MAPQMGNKKVKEIYFVTTFATASATFFYVIVKVEIKNLKMEIIMCSGLTLFYKIIKFPHGYD